MATAGAQVRETTSGPTVKQFSVFLSNKVGALLEIIRILNESEVHVIGLNSQDSTDSAIVRIIVSDPEAVEQIFDLHEVAYSISEILVVEMREVAVDLKKLLSCLLMAEVNIQVCYPLLLVPTAVLPWLSTWTMSSAPDRSWGGRGFTILNQTDLSR